MIDMARQGNKMVSELEDASKNLKASVEKAGDDLRKASDNLRTAVTKSVDEGKRVVKDHPAATLGVAIGASFAAGAIVGSRMERRMKNKANAAAKGKAE